MNHEKYQLHRYLQEKGYNTNKRFIASYYRQLSADIKIKNHKIKTSFISSEGRKAWTYITLIQVESSLNMMLHMILQYG